MCSLSVLLNSCDDFLKEEPLDMKSSDQFWKTKADAESGVNALYFGGVPYLHNTDVGGVMAGLEKTGDVRRALAYGAAAGCASVMTEGTQLIRPDDFAALLPQVQIQDV